MMRSRTHKNTTNRCHCTISNVAPIKWSTRIRISPTTISRSRLCERSICLCPRISKPSIWPHTWSSNSPIRRYLISIKFFLVVRRNWIFVVVVVNYIRKNIRKRCKAIRQANNRARWIPSLIRNFWCKFNASSQSSCGSWTEKMSSLRFSTERKFEIFSIW